MEKQYLLPHSWKRWGRIAFFTGLVLFILLAILMAFLVPWKELFGDNTDKPVFSDTAVLFFSTTRWLLGLIAILIPGGLALIAFSEERTEDEYIQRLRRTSFFNAVLYNYVLLMLLYFALPGPGFLRFFGWSIFTVLCMYVLDFHLRLHYQDKLDEIENGLKQAGKDAK